MKSINDTMVSTIYKLFRKINIPKHNQLVMHNWYLKHGYKPVYNKKRFYYKIKK